MIPASQSPKDASRMVEMTLEMVQNVSDTELLSDTKATDEKLGTSLKFYSLMTTAAFFARPEMCTLLTSRMVQLTVRHGVACEYSMLGFVQFAAGLFVRKTLKDVPSVLRMGKAAMARLAKRSHSPAQLSKMYSVYYALVAHFAAPLQDCADMHWRGYEAGMSAGENGTAFLNLIGHVKASLASGEKLTDLLERVDRYLERAVLYKNEVSRARMINYRNTISTLIDKGEATGPESYARITTTTDKAVDHFHGAIRAYWLGHSERCHHYIGKFLPMCPAIGRLAHIIIMFIYGMNSFQVIKRQNTVKVRALPGRAIAVLRTAAKHSRWNFFNKVHLLEAENYSFLGNHEEAKASYAAAITSARCSRFIHEQGLACERAAFHYKKIGDHDSARSFLGQAKQCYAKWGSRIKVESIVRQLETYQNSTT